MNEKLKKFLSEIYTNKGVCSVAKAACRALDVPESFSTISLFSALTDENTNPANATLPNLSNTSSLDAETNAVQAEMFKKLSDIKKDTVNDWIDEATAIFFDYFGDDANKEVFKIFGNNFQQINTLSNGKDTIGNRILVAYCETFAELKGNIASLDCFVNAALKARKNDNLPSHLNNGEWPIRSVIKMVPDEKKEIVKNAVKTILMNRAIVYTPNHSTAISFVASNDDSKYGHAMYYFDFSGNNSSFKRKTLIKKNSLVDENSFEIENKNSLNDTDLLKERIRYAVTRFDKDSNSALISYALEKLESMIRQKDPILKMDRSGSAVLASQIAFLSLCDSFGKEVDSDVLFAFANPMAEIDATSQNALEKAVEAANDVVKGLTGKDPFAEQGPSIIGENGNPESGNDEPPESENGGNPEDDNHENPENGNGDSSDNGNVGNPEDANGGNPEGGNDENPENGNGSFTPPKDVKSLIKEPKTVSCAKIVDAAAFAVCKLFRIARQANISGKEKNVTIDHLAYLGGVESVFGTEKEAIKKEVKNKNKNEKKYFDKEQPPVTDPILQNFIDKLSEIFKSYKKEGSILKERIKELERIADDEEKQKEKEQLVQDIEAYNNKTLEIENMRKAVGKELIEVLRNIPSFGETFANDFSDFLNNAEETDRE